MELEPKQENLSSGTESRMIKTNHTISILASPSFPSSPPIPPLPPPPSNTERKTPFKTESILEFMKRCENDPKPKKLVGDLIYHHEQVVLFSPTGLGKSLLAFQFALSICKGISVDLGNGIILENEVGSINTLLFDFELSDSQLIERIGHIELPDNLFISKIARGNMLEGSPKQIFNLIKEEAKIIKAKFIIIDNMSKIGSELEKSDKAKQFMNALWDLVRFEEFTVLIIAHTPKMDKRYPITSDSLGGSSKIGQLADALIGINEVNSKDGSKVYIKQIKNRNNAKLFGKDNVICTEIRPDENNFVRHFAYKTCHEDIALNEYNQSDSKIGDKIHAEACHLLYGSFKKASEVVNISDSTLKQRSKALKNKHKDVYENLQKMNVDELKKQIRNVFTY